MRTQVYEGYFADGKFYVSGQPVLLPERQRVVVTVLDEPQEPHSQELADRLKWVDEFVQLAKKTEHENHLLDCDSFKRDKTSRELSNFFDKE